MGNKIRKIRNALLKGLRFPVYSLKTSLSGVRTNLDDFNWDTYTDHYKKELSITDKKYLTRFNENRDIEVQLELLDPVIGMLYQTLNKLKPKSVMEYGCGGADHLYNLGKLMPNTKLFGVDRSANQIAFAIKRNNAKNIFLKIINDNEEDLKFLFKCDLVYSQAVLMHIQTKQSYQRALRHMLDSANDYIVIRENLSRHSFIDDFVAMVEGGETTWKSVYFYTLKNDEMLLQYGKDSYSLNNTLLIISKKPFKDDRFRPISDLSFVDGFVSSEEGRSMV